MEYSSAGSMFSVKSGKSFRTNLDVINRLEAKLGVVIPSFLVAQRLVASALSNEKGLSCG